MSGTVELHALRRVLTSVASLALLSAAIGCEKLPTGPSRVTRAGVRGMTLADWTANGYAGSAARDGIAFLCGCGVNTLALIVTAYQSDATSGLIAADPARTPSPGAVRTALAEARSRGLAVTLKPHVDLYDGKWRGTIRPGDPDAWFASYRAFILPWAALAESVGAAQFVIGTELAGTLGEEGQWRDLIRAVREVYHGQLVYAASWDEAGDVPFWGEMDLVGVDFYFPVASRTQPGRLELLAGWQPWLERLERLHRRTGRPILLTEIGYRSVDGAGMRPYAFDAEVSIDLGEQADLYWAALQATGDKPWIAGLYWWNWRADASGGAQNSDYTPNRKPAITELRSAWMAAP